MSEEKSTARGAEAPWSDQAAFGEGHGVASRHDDVIQRADIHQRQRLLEPLGQCLVSATRLWIAARVVVRILCPVFLCAVLGGQERTSWASGQNRGT